MKKLTGFIVIILLAGISASAQSINGNWEGDLDVNGTAIPIVFHIQTEGNGFTGTFDSPKQMAYGLAISNIRTGGDSIILEMDVLKGRYAAKLGDKTMNGYWYQGGAVFPLMMEQVNGTVSTSAPVRPQTPKEPFNYTSEELTYYNTDKSIRFGATFTVPKKIAGVEYFREPIYPTAILITGSGQQDRDETIMGHKPFAVIADQLSRQGIAVLRIDDRGTGNTTGNFDTSNTRDFALDVEAAIDFLKTRKDVDLDRIGLIGHSEGGMIAPMVAAKRKDLNFIVLLAGPGVPIIDLMSEQIEAVARSKNSAPELVKAGSELFRLAATTINSNKDTALVRQKIMQQVEDWASKTGKSILEKMELSTAAARKAYVNAQVDALLSSWYRYFLAFDPSVWLKQVRCRVLALNGEKDIQVMAASNLAGIRESLQSAHNADYTITSRPGLNHLFQNCKKCTVEEYGELEETFDPATLQLIIDWIKK